MLGLEIGSNWSVCIFILFNVRKHNEYFSTWRTFEACYFVPNQYASKCLEVDADHLKMDKYRQIKLFGYAI